MKGFSLLAQLQVVTTRHGVTREPFFERLKPLWNLMRLGSQCLDGHLGNAISRPTRWRRRVHKVLKNLLQVAHGSQICTLLLTPSSINDG